MLGIPLHCPDGGDPVVITSKVNIIAKWNYATENSANIDISIFDLLAQQSAESDQLLPADE